MGRRTIRLLGAALIAAFALGSVSEAAPPKTIRHRARHVPGSSFRAATAPPVAKKKATRRKPATKATAKRKAKAQTHKSTKPR